MRWVLCLVFLLACKSDDDYDLRPPGGGGGTGNQDPPDASEDDPIDGGGVENVAGRLCVIEDFQDPFACLDQPLSRDVLVEEVVAGGLTTRTDGNSEFVLEVTGLPAVLDAGAEGGDLLFPTRSTATTATDVDVPAVDELLFEDVLLILEETLSGGAALVYVVDAGGPVPGATVTGFDAGARVYYDDGVGGYDGNETSTGPDGIALVLDTGGAVVTADDGVRTAIGRVETASQTIGVLVLTLPDR